MTGVHGDHLLSPYRVLDLTDERGLLCGKILADLGADVIQIEPPGGSSARDIGPFYQDDVHPEKSLFWWAYAVNKRGITLNLETDDGQQLLKRMVQDAHFLIESFPPGYLDRLGLGYEALEAINPELILVSITPFGQDGPYAHYKATDVTGMAMSGLMYLTGDPDRAPVRVGFPQFYLHGAAAGATGAMLAHSARTLTGQGQHVDVSCQQAVARSLAHAPQFWQLENLILKRLGSFRQNAGETKVRVNWQCKDGYVNFMPGGGGAGSARSVRSLLAWMREAGMPNEALEAVKWEDLGYGTGRAEVMDLTAEAVGAFFAEHTRDYLVSESVERRVMLFPVATETDIFTHPQLEARGYFKELSHPELDASVTYPGMFIKDEGGSRVGIQRRPPLIGEHNVEMYQGELGLTSETLKTLKQGKVI
ncbi:MAG: CoA transferase [Candidatus Tectomicrobia bacterium]|nr:CoA transferase [Candidatus Tectomicrobia bacterium]